MIQESAIESALATLRPGLSSDGFDLRVGEPQDGDDAQVILEAKPDACLDCLVPDAVMVQMLETAIRQKSPSLGKVELVRQGFDAVEGH